VTLETLCHIREIHSNHQKFLSKDDMTPSCWWTVRELYVNTAVKKGCLKEPFLYLLAIDWIINDKRTAKWDPVEHGGAALSFRVCR